MKFESLINNSYYLISIKGWVENVGKDIIGYNLSIHTKIIYL